MPKTFADAIFEAEKHGTHDLKFAALSGLEGDEIKLAQEALNPYRVFNVKKFDLPQVYANADTVYSSFFELLNCLVDRTLTGNAARLAITGVLSQYTEETAKALTRVLLKDLRCGAGVSIFKKLYPSITFPDFELMLAAKIEEKPEVVRKTDIELTPAIMLKKYGLKFPVIAEAKYDGKRLLAIVENGNVQYLTRSGNTADWCNGLFDAELLKIEAYLGYSFVLDGEVLARSFSETAKAKGSKNDDAKEQLSFYAFDWMPLSTWKYRTSSRKQYERSDMVLQFVEILGLRKIIKSKSKKCYSIAELKAFYAEILKDGVNADGTLNGLGEGLIIKNVDGLYEWDRSKNWFKWKPVLDVDLTIVGFYIGDKGTKNENKLGGITLKGADENGRPIYTNCGGFKVSGAELKKFIDEKIKEHNAACDPADLIDTKVVNRDQFFRNYVWTHQAEFLGMTAMIEGQELSLAEGAVDYAVRFPQFVCIRTDK